MWNNCGCGGNQVSPAYDNYGPDFCGQVSPSYDYGKKCGSSVFVLIVVLFILLIIVGCSFK
ncbi:YjcZ family sporulation protein [Ureibacillus composti]|nr:YjcZ family sporulation protein [Ureibacillus composti]